MESSYYSYFFFLHDCKKKSLYFFKEPIQHLFHANKVIILRQIFIKDNGNLSQITSPYQFAQSIVQISYRVNMLLRSLWTFPWLAP